MDPATLISANPFVAFAVATGIVLVAGVRMTGIADRLADRTGLGEAVTGGLLLGATTSLSGAVVSITAALDGRAGLAFSNGVGGIAAQTAFLALADIAWRRVNLEHAAADLSNVLQASLLCLMLALPMLAFTGPDIAVLGVHPVSLALPVIYIYGMRASAGLREDPMWEPVDTPETRTDSPDDDDEAGRPITPLALRFVGLAAVLALAGWAIARAGGEISDRMDISQSTVGALMTAVATSLPELVTTLAAVRRGAAQLAVGGIIGGNAFDVLFLSASDIAYRDGSIYAAVGPGELFWVAVGISMTAVLLLGLILRQKAGPARIGFESVALLAIYVGAVAVQALAP